MTVPLASLAVSPVTLGTVTEPSAVQVPQTEAVLDDLAGAVVGDVQGVGRGAAAEGQEAIGVGLAGRRARKGGCERLAASVVGRPVPTVAT